jgi:hypothetical protein
MTGTDGLVRASFDGGIDEQSVVLRALVEAGIPVASFTAAGGLEELFMTLTEEAAEA